MSEIPHFSLPFRFTPTAAVCEQDSLEEVADCLLAVLVCPAGFRVELPAFGLPDPTFSTPRVNREALRETVEEWEPRAAISFAADEELVQSTSLQLSPELIDTVRMTVGLRTEE